MINIIQYNHRELIFTAQRAGGYKKMLSNNLKNIRKQAGITQEKLAQLTNVRRETIIRLEKNLYNPSLELAFKIAKVLKCDINVIFQYSNDQIMKEPEQIEGQTELHTSDTDEFNILDNELKMIVMDIKRLEDISDFIEYYYIQVERWENKEINFNQWAFIELVYSNIDYDSDLDNPVKPALIKGIEERNKRYKI